MSADRYDALERRIGHVFADRTLLIRALTHASYGDGRREVRDNERLEFLGDRVLGLLVARQLFDEFADADEGGLAPRLNALVRKETCARVASRAGLGEALRMSRAEERNGGRTRATILGDAAEALLAAIYLDGGYPAALAFFDAFWAEEFVAVAESPRDPKTRLQEWALARGLPIPDYDVAGRTGPDHRPRFVVRVKVSGLSTADGEGPSKQAAERAAAELLLEREKLND